MLPAFSWKNVVKKSAKKISRKKNLKKKFQKIFHEIFSSNFFLAIGVPQPIWGMPAKIWGSRPAGLGGDRDCTNST
jgi:hypothetical protein